MVLIDTNEKTKSSAQPFNDFSLAVPSSRSMSSTGGVGTRNIYQKRDDSSEPAPQNRKFQEPNKVAPLAFERDGKASNQRPILISPFLHQREWSSKSLFRKNAEPSPVAAVAPLTRKQAKQAQAQSVSDCWGVFSHLFLCSAKI